MGKVIDYFVVVATTVHSLEIAVKRTLKDGWEPLGNPIFQPGTYSQAMIMRER